MKRGPPTFLEEINRVIVEGWMTEMEKIFYALGCTNEQKLMFVIYRLQGEAAHWWKTTNEKLMRSETPRTWEKLKEEFQLQFVPKMERIKKENEFLALKQGDLAVGQYETKFTELARESAYMIPTDELRARSFLVGIKPNLRLRVIVLNVETFADVARKAKELEGAIEEARLERVSAGASTPVQIVGQVGGIWEETTRLIVRGIDLITRDLGVEILRTQFKEAMEIRQGTYVLIAIHLYTPSSIVGKDWEDVWGVVHRIIK